MQISSQIRILKNCYKIRRQRSGFCFHSVSNFQNPFYTSKLHNLTFRRFKEVINTFKKVVTFLPALEYLEEVNRIKSAISTITFDDAYHDIFEGAIPFLQDNGIPSTVFVNSSTLDGNYLWRDWIRLIIQAGKTQAFLDFIGNDKFRFTIDNFYSESKTTTVNSNEVHKEIKEFVQLHDLKPPKMLYAKIETLQNFSKSHLVAIGNHTANHYLLSSLKKDEQKKEIINGKIFLDRHGIKNELVFAAPFGGYKSINKLTLDILEEHDYKGLFLTNGISRVDKSKLPRPTPLAISNRFLPH